jgi:hypothetical protein
MSGIYKGYNPIYESLRKELFEQENKVDLGSLKKIIYDTFTHLLLNSSDEAVKNPDGFKAYMADVLKVGSLDGLEQEMLKKIDALIQTDKDQESALKANKDYISQLFDQLKGLVGDKADAVKKTMDDFNSYTTATITSLQGVKTVLQQNESLISRYISEQRTGEENRSEEGIGGKWYTDLSKSCLDTATSFAGEVSSAASSSNLSGNPQIQQFADMSNQYLETAKQLVVVGGRKGLFATGKIPTASGDMKAKDYRVKAQNLINEIIRQREEFQKVRYKLANVPAPPQPAVVCPAGFAYDPATKTCVMVGKPPRLTGGGKDDSGGGGTPTPTPSKGCDFPIAVGSKKCDSVRALQEKLMSMGDCIADILKKKGGADGIYGSTTAKLVNITYAYLSGATSFDAAGSLDQAKYDKIMGGGTVTFQAKESYYTAPTEEFQKIVESKIFEMESKAPGAVISFDQFSKAVLEAAEEQPGMVPKPVNLADCICKSYASGSLDSICSSTIVPTPGPDDNDKKKGDKDKEKDKDNWEWKGLKPLPDGIYALAFDESWGEWWRSKGTTIAVGVILVAAIAATAGALAPAGVAAVGAAEGGAAVAGGAEAAAVAGAETAAAGAEVAAGTEVAAGAETAATAGAEAGAETAATTGAEAGAETAAKTGAEAAAKTPKLSILGRLKNAIKGGAGLAGAKAGAVKALTNPVAVGAGIVGVGAAKALFDGRSGVGVSLFNGYLSKTAVMSITRGLANTYDGYVTRDDIQAFMSTLCVLRGAWTDVNGRPVSAWAEVKRRYTEMESEDVDKELGDGEYGTRTVRDVHNFPDFESDSMADGTVVNADDAKQLVEDAVKALDQNEADLAENLTHITPEEVKEIKKGVRIVKTDANAAKGGETKTKEAAPTSKGKL